MSGRAPRRAGSWIAAGLVTVLVALLPAGPTLATGTTATGRYIVVLGEGTAGGGVERTVARLRTGLGIRPTQTYRHAIHGFAASLDARRLAALHADPDVAYIAPDLPMILTAQPLPPYFDRVEADVAPVTHYDGTDEVTPGDGQRVDADIAILDTGVDDTHPDLNVVGGHDCALLPAPGPGDPIPDGDPEWGDINGHGTHVAGIAGAFDNGIGVVGVAPGARIWSVRIFGRDIRGYTSNLLCGIDWVTAQRDPGDADRPLFESANMSMRVAGHDDGACGSVNHDPVHTAICDSVAAGNVYAVAAGNEANDAQVYIPASYDEVITVSALADFDGKPGGLAAQPAACEVSIGHDADDTFADFSTSGLDVDLIAPGECVSSTYPVSKGSYRTISGTSMATPAVAAGAALYRIVNPDATPEQVRAGLIAAGSRDWFRGTDPDGHPDPLLDVSSAGAAPDFSLDVRPKSAGVRPENQVSMTVDVRRGFSFLEPVELTVEGVPVGGSATFSPSTIAAPTDTASVLTVQLPTSEPGTSYLLTVRATGQTSLLQHTATVTVLVDTTPPVVTAPIARFAVGAPLAGANVPLRLTWSATDATAPIQYQAWRRTNGAAWTALGLASPTATETLVAVPPGPQYRFKVRATDGATNHHTASGPTMTFARRSESSPSIGYTGAWATRTMSGAYGGSLRSGDGPGAQATVTFTGRAFAWVAPRTSAGGIALVTVDGGAPVSVDLHSAATISSRVVFARDWPASGSHTVRIKVVGTAGHPRVYLDELFTLS